MDVAEAGEAPGAFVISHNAQVLSEPQSGGSPVSTLKRWTVIPRLEGQLLVEEDGWVKLGEGRYIEDESIARFRKARRPRRLRPDEKWIAVDVKEQLLHAYEGEKLVRVIPCSTGKRGNTEPGRYRIQWKRRLQTMRMKKGHLRIEDVQWVMYYDRKDGIAIHTAYWHDSFGTPVSHGCVNLPSLDAKWLFEWSSPRVLPEDSESFSAPGQAGSRVMVFR